MTRISLEFITPLFSKGCYDDRPEIRPPSIRGQLHWWMRALGGTAIDEKAIFGSVHQDFGGRGSGVAASKIVVRIAEVSGATGSFPALKHKERQGNQANPRIAYAPGTTCELHLLERLGGLSNSQKQLFEKALYAWLLMGTLGLRGTRAAGSLAWEALEKGPSAPGSWETYGQAIQEVVGTAALKVAILEKPYSAAEDARRDVSDTIGGRDDRQGSTELQRLRDPLGKVFGGRKTSPLRFRIARVGAEYRIIAVWDDRQAVTGNRHGDLEGVIELLVKKGKPIGTLLNQASF